MIVVGLSHKSAPVAVRERVAIAESDLERTLQDLRGLPAVAEVAVLSTCNRVEVYVEPDRGADESTVQRRVVEFLADRGGREVVPHLIAHVGADAVQHVFRVASSLDSLVLGEPQILGQLKGAFRSAEEARTVGQGLGQVMRGALQTAKRVRTETAIGSGQVSVPTVAVDLARQIFEELAGQCALMVGAGEMAESAAKLLARAGARVTVVNRSPARAEALAAAVGGTPSPWTQLDDELVGADIVVCSTASPTPIIDKQQLKALRRKRRGRSLFLIDIAVPRDVDPNVDDLDFVYLYDVDDLSQVVAQSLEGRRHEAERAEVIVRREARQFEERRSQQAVKPVVVALRQRARATMEAELSRSFKKQLKHLSEADRKSLGIMMDAAVNKLLHAPTRQLKQLAGTERGQEAAALVAHLFDIEEAVVQQAEEARSKAASDAAHGKPPPSLDAAAGNALEEVAAETGPPPR